MEGAEYGAGADNSGNSLPFALDVESIKDADNAPPPVNNVALPLPSTKLAAISCKKILKTETLDSGWGRALRLGASDSISDAVDYLQTLPGVDKLGYGSACHLGSLIEAQCKLSPRSSVLDSINSLLTKATAGKPLPKTPPCGM
jgi:hypothetical protein